MKTEELAGYAIFGILFILIIFLASPFVTLWALSTLFGVNIEWNFATWAAALWFHGLVGATKIKYNKD